MSSTAARNGAVQSQPKNRKQPAVAQVHDESKSIRNQSKSKKEKTEAQANMLGNPADRAGMSKEIVKAVLASPLTVAWPNIPRHLQTATLHAMKDLVPSSVADYHVSRARCHTREKQAKRREQRRQDKVGRQTKDDRAKDEHVSEQGDGLEESEVIQDRTRVGDKRRSTTIAGSGQPASKKPRTEEPVQSEELVTGLKENEAQRPTRPEILTHLVLGINEVIKSLETQIDELKLQLMMMGDVLNGQRTGRPIASAKERNGQIDGTTKVHLLPTAPRSPSPEDEDEHDMESPSAASRPSGSPLEFIIIPLLSVNPPSLVSPIPQYCATYNALVYQHAQLSRICKTRLEHSVLAEVLGTEREEVRVVPLGAVELEMAQMVGLRRLACLGIRSSHPTIGTIRNLLPKSILHAPRHALTLPFPSSTLKVHINSTSNSAKSTFTKSQTSSLPSRPIAIPDVHYAELHIKGVQTKIPVDNNARKAKRLEEVRKKRVGGKLKKKLAKVRMGASSKDKVTGDLKEEVKVKKA